jgi:hypothetical protein
MTGEERRRAGAAVAARISDLHTNAAAVARRAGVDPRTVRRMIDGTTWPRQSVRDRINEALHWPPGEITRRAVELSGLAGYSSRVLIDELCRRAAAWPYCNDQWLDR